MDSKTIYALCLGVGLGSGIIALLWLLLGLLLGLPCETALNILGFVAIALALVGIGLFLGLRILNRE